MQPTRRSHKPSRHRRIPLGRATIMDDERKVAHLICSCLYTLNSNGFVEAYHQKRFVRIFMGDKRMKDV